MGMDRSCFRPGTVRLLSNICSTIALSSPQKASVSVLKPSDSVQVAPKACPVCVLFWAQFCASFGYYPWKKHPMSVLNGSQGSPQKIRRPFDDMLNVRGCPECKSPHTYDTVASVNDQDDVEVCLCDNCGHVELKYDIRP
jgi:hypothetical protein